MAEADKLDNRLDICLLLCFALAMELCKSGSRKIQGKNNSRKSGQ